MFDSTLDMVPFLTQKVYSLNSVIKTSKIEQFWAETKGIQLDQRHTKQFSLLESFSLVFFNKKNRISQGHFLKFLQNLLLSSFC